MSDINSLRRELLGQLDVLTRRIEKLREQLIDEPEYGDKPPALSVGTADAIGNLTFQVGALVGLASKYMDALR